MQRGQSKRKQGIQCNGKWKQGVKHYSLNSNRRTGNLYYKWEYQMAMISEKLDIYKYCLTVVSGSPFLLDLWWMPTLGMGRSLNLLIKCRVLCWARYFLYFVYFHDYFKSQVFFLSLSRYKNRFRDIKWLIIITQELKKLFSQVSLIQKPMLFRLSVFASFRREMGQDKDKDENMHLHSVTNALAPWIIILILLLL